MREVDLRPEEAAALQVSDRCSDCGHLQVFHHAGPDWADDYCLAGPCDCKGMEYLPDLGELDATCPGIRLIKADGTVQVIE